MQSGNSSAFRALCYFTASSFAKFSPRTTFISFTFEPRTDCYKVTLIHFAQAGALTLICCGDTFTQFAFLRETFYTPLVPPVDTDTASLLVFTKVANCRHSSSQMWPLVPVPNSCPSLSSPNYTS